MAVVVKAVVVASVDFVAFAFSVIVFLAVALVVTMGIDVVIASGKYVRLGSVTTVVLVAFPTFGMKTIIVADVIVTNAHCVIIGHDFISIGVF